MSHAHFCRTAGDADHAAAEDLADLARDRPDRTRRARHDDGVAFFRLPDVEHPEVGREPGDAEHAEIRGDGILTGHGHHPVGAGAGDRVVRPINHPEDEVPDLVVRAARLHDLADRTAAHRVADLDAGDVGVEAVHPDPDSGVERQVQGSDERFAVGGLGNGRLDDLEVALLDGPGRVRSHLDHALGRRDRRVGHAVSSGSSMRASHRPGASSSAGVGSIRSDSHSRFNPSGPARSMTPRQNAAPCS